MDEATRIGQRYRAPKGIVFVVNTDRLFLSHRAAWGVAFQTAGACVTVIAEDTGASGEIRGLGFRFIDVPVGRETTPGATKLASAARVFAALLRIRPQVVFLVHQVAYTLGWPAALLLRGASFIRVAGGVGRALDTAALGSMASRIVRVSGRNAGRLSNVFTLFQIEHDRQTFMRLGLLPHPQRSLVVPGTGIDMTEWHTSDVRDFVSPVVLFASRLIREKGIYEFVDAARDLQGRGWRFQVAGDPDPGVESSVDDHQLQQWREETDIEFLGHRTDMARVLGDATLFVFPSRHPEGTPRVLIEAGACGLPAIVTGLPGCVAVVEDGVSGMVLSHEPSVTEVVAAITAVASDPAHAHAMGAAARNRIAQSFSQAAVLTQVLEWIAVKAVPV